MQQRRKTGPKRKSPGEGYRSCNRQPGLGFRRLHNGTPSMSDGQTPGIGDNGPPVIAVLPGEILNAAFLTPHRLTPADLDGHLDLTPGTVQAIVEGRRRITGWMSQLLGKAFGVTGSYFSHLQEQYDDDAATADEREEHESEHRFELAEKLANKLGRAPGSLAPAPEFAPDGGKLGGLIND